MALKYGPFNGLENAWDAYDLARYLKTFIGNGIFPNTSTNMQVLVHNNMQTKVVFGIGFIEGHYLLNESDFILTHDIADGLLKRIDRIVMRVNFLEDKAEILIKKGTLASSPTAPTLVRNTDYHELALADVYITNGTTIITQANITDQRFNKALCGIVKGLVDEIDTTGLFAQYDARFNQWFAAIQGALSGDVAGNLQNQIGNLTNLKTTDKTSLVNSINEVKQKTEEKILSSNVPLMKLIFKSIAISSKTSFDSVIVDLLNDLSGLSFNSGFVYNGISKVMTKGSASELAVTTTTKAISSGDLSGYTAFRPFLTIPEQWRSSQSGAATLNAFIGVNFGVNTTIKKIKLIQSNGVSSVKIQYFDTQWRDAQVFNNLTWSDELLIDGNFIGTQWRIVANAAVSAYNWNINEIKMYDNGPTEAIWTPDTAAFVPNYAIASIDAPGMTDKTSLYISRNGGANFTKCLPDVVTDISSQPLGTSIVFKLISSEFVGINGVSWGWK